jgi:hypothetical protein
MANLGRTRNSQQAASQALEPYPLLTLSPSPGDLPTDCGSVGRGWQGSIGRGRPDGPQVPILSWCCLPHGHSGHTSPHRPEQRPPTSTRSKAEGVPPRCTWPSTVTLVSKPSLWTTSCLLGESREAVSSSRSHCSLLMGPGPSAHPASGLQGSLIGP